MAFLSLMSTRCGLVGMLNQGEAQELAAMATYRRFDHSFDHPFDQW